MKFGLGDKNRPLLRASTPNLRNTFFCFTCAQSDNGVMTGKTFLSPNLMLSAASQHEDETGHFVLVPHVHYLNIKVRLMMLTGGNNEG